MSFTVNVRDFLSWWKIFGRRRGWCTTDPRVFLTILVFDKKYNLIDTKYQQISGDVDVWDYYDVNYTAKEESYVYAYISQEDVHFMNCWVDDVTMTYTPSRIVQYNEYYPFGLQTAASWSRPSKTENKNLYDAGSELNKTTGFYDLPYRNYDPSVGRFFQVDGQAMRTPDRTPYHYSGNNPVGFNDPSGLHREPPPIYWGPSPDPWGGIPEDWDNQAGGSDPIDTDGDGTYSNNEIQLAYNTGIISQEDAAAMMAANQAAQATTPATNSSTDTSPSASGSVATGPPNPTQTVADPTTEEHQDDDVVTEDMLKSGDYGGEVSDDDDQKNLPTKDKGGFVDPDDFLEYMQNQAKTNNVEVAAWTLREKTTGNLAYFVLPWAGNHVDGAATYVDNLAKVIPGFSNYDPVSANHTHVYFMSQTPSPPDVTWTIAHPYPLYTINAVGPQSVNYVTINGVSSIYNGY